MSDEQFRAVLDWWMCSDPFPVPRCKGTIDAWLLQECKNRGYKTITEAFHAHKVT